MGFKSDMRKTDWIFLIVVAAVSSAAIGIMAGVEMQRSENEEERSSCMDDFDSKCAQVNATVVERFKSCESSMQIIRSFVKRDRAGECFFRQDTYEYSATEEDEKELERGIGICSEEMRDCGTKVLENFLDVR